MKHPPTNLLPYDGTACLFENLLPAEACAVYERSLLAHIAWRQESIRIFGKEVMQPRLTAWYGDEGKSYRYSGLTMHPLPWNELLLDLKSVAEAVSGTGFNSALLNLYRNGNDSMGWHRDNEPELGPDPVIASLSFGAARTFRFRHYKNKKPVISLLLPPGSLLLMGKGTQQHWQHALPRSAGVQAPRINITFRNISG